MSMEQNDIDRLGKFIAENAVRATPSANAVCNNCGLRHEGICHLGPSPAPKVESDVLKSLAAEFQRWLDNGPNEQPHYSDGMRPFSTGDLKAFVAALAASPPMIEVREAATALLDDLDLVYPETASYRPSYYFRMKLREALSASPPKIEQDAVDRDLALWNKVVDMILEWEDNCETAGALAREIIAAIAKEGDAPIGKDQVERVTVGEYHEGDVMMSPDRMSGWHYRDGKWCPFGDHKAVIAKEGDA